MAVTPPDVAPNQDVPALLPLGSHAGKPPLRLTKALILVGSEKNCHLVLSSSTISRYHALILTSPDGVYVRDLVSRTGLIVNNKKVSEANLKDGDELGIGRFKFKFSAPKAFAPVISAEPAALTVQGRTEPVSLTRRAILIGRQPGCDIHFTQDSVSSRHTLIFTTGGRRFVRDLYSRKGTVLNGTPIHQHEFNVGDELVLGEAVLEMVAAPTAVAAAEPEVAERIDLATDPDIADIPGATAMLEPISEVRPEPVIPDELTIEPAPEPEPEPELPPEPAPAAQPEPVMRSEKADRGWRRTTWKESAAHAQPAPAEVQPAPAAEAPEPIHEELPPLAIDFEEATTTEAPPTEEAAPVAEQIAPQTPEPEPEPMPIEEAPAPVVEEPEPVIESRAPISIPSAPRPIIQPASKALEMPPVIKQAPPPTVAHEVAPGIADIAAFAEVTPAAEAPVEELIAIEPESITIPAPVEEPLAVEPAPPAVVEAPAPIATIPESPAVAEEAPAPRRRGRPRKTPAAPKPPRARRTETQPPEPAPEFANLQLDLQPKSEQPLAEEPSGPIEITSEAPLSLLPAELQLETPVVEPMEQAATPIEGLQVHDHDLSPPSISHLAQPEAVEVEATNPPEALIEPVIEELPQVEDLPQSLLPSPEVTEESVVASAERSPESILGLDLDLGTADHAVDSGTSAPIDADDLALDALAAAPSEAASDVPEVTADHSDEAEALAADDLALDAISATGPSEPMPREIENLAPEIPIQPSEPEPSIELPAAAAPPPTPMAPPPIALPIPAMSAPPQPPKPPAPIRIGPPEQESFSLDDGFFNVDPASVGFHVEEGPAMRQPPRQPRTITTNASVVQPVLPPPIVAPPRPPAAPEPEQPMHSLGGAPLFREAANFVDGHFGEGDLKLPEHKVPESFGHVAVAFDQPVEPIAKSQPPVEPAPEEIAPPPEPEPEPAPVEPVAEAPAPTPEVKIPPPPPRPTRRERRSAIAAAPAQPQTPPRPPRSTFATDPFDISPEDLAVQHAPAPGKPPASVFSAFDGLAMPAVQERDVFSDFNVNDHSAAAFLGGSAAAAAAEEVSEVFESDSDFADDDFWNRTDDDEPLPETIAPKQAAAVAVAPPAPARPKPPASVAPPVKSPVAKAPAPESRPRQESTPAAISVAKNVVAPQAPAVETKPPQVKAAPVAPIEEIELPPMDLEEAFAEPEPVAAAETPTMKAPEPARRSALPVAPPPVAAPSTQPRRAKRRRLLPFLVLAMLITMSGAVAGIVFLWPPKTTVVGSLTYLNFDWVEGTDSGNNFSSQQRRFLEDANVNAADLLAQKHVGVTPGFLANRPAYLRVADGFTLFSSRPNNVPQTVLRVNYQGGDPHDAYRVEAMLSALVRANDDTLSDNRKKLSEAQSAQDTVNADEKKIQDLTDQIAVQQRFVDKKPSAPQLASLAADVQKFHKARTDAEEVVENDRLAVARQPAVPGADAASTQPSADPQLAEMRQEMDDLSSRLAAAKTQQTAGADQARTDFESAAKQFNDEVAAVGNNLGDDSQLKQFLNSVADSQSKARDLITSMLIDGQDLQKEVEDVRQDLEEDITSRQAQVWASDVQLQGLQESLDSAQHRYNAAVGQGIKEDSIVAPLQAEIDGWTSKVKARQAALGVDPKEVKVREGLNKLLASMHTKLDHEKQNLDDVLAPLARQLSALNPTIAAMPANQQEMAKEIRQKLDSMNKARQGYAVAMGQSQAEPSQSVTELQQRLADLKARFDRRQMDLTRQIQNTTGDVRVPVMVEAQKTLDSDKQAIEDARTAYESAGAKYDQAMRLSDEADTASANIDQLKVELKSRNDELEAARRDLDQKQQATVGTFDIRPLTEADVMQQTAPDPRRDYSLFAVAALSVAFAIVVMILPHDGGSREPPQSFASHADLTRAVFSPTDPPTGNGEAHPDLDDDEHQALMA